MSHRAQIPALDGLRGLACLMVVFFHAGIYGWGSEIKGLGDAGVMLFFTLSGFLMAHHYMPEHFSWHYWASFWIRRFFRVYPAFFVATLAYLAFHHNVPKPEPTWNTGDWQALINHWLLKNISGIMWTIPVEMKFYAVYPLIASSLILPQFRKYAFEVALALWVSAIIIHQHIGEGAYTSSAIFFLGGIMASCLYTKNQKMRLLRETSMHTVALVLLGVMALFSITNPLQHYPDSTRLFRFGGILSPLLALLLICVSLSHAWINTLFSHPIARFFGTISYSMYLTHLFVQYPMRKIFPPEPLYILLMAATVLAVACIFYRLVEKPFHKLGVRLSGTIAAQQK